MPARSIVIIRSSFSTHGGVEKNTLGVIKNLLDKKINVQLLTWPQQKWPISHPGLQIIPVGTNKGPRFLQALSFNRGVENYLKKKDATCIFSFDRVAAATHIHGGGGTHRSFLRIKNARANFFSRALRRLSLFHQYTLYMEKKGFLSHRLKKIRCASSLVKKDIIKDYGVREDKLTTLPNSIDWNQIGTIFTERQKTASLLARRHQLNPSLSYLLFIGSGFERKGLDIAIRGLSKMPATYGLIVVGKGRRSVYESLSKKLSIDQRVYFLGPQPDGWKYASLCKALILPSRYEPFGIACAEANAMGIPVLISEKTGYIDLVTEGKNGVILKFPDSSENIADAFSRLLKVIETPSQPAEEIRKEAYHLDHKRVMKILIDDFLDI